MTAVLIVCIYYLVGAGRIWFMHHDKGGFRNLLMWRTMRVQQRIPGVPLPLVAFAETFTLFVRVSVWPLSTDQWRKLTRVPPEDGAKMDREQAEFIASLKQGK